MSPESWPDVPLGEAATWLSGGTPRTSEPAYWNGDIPWITSSSLTKFRLSDSQRRLTPEGLKSGSRLVPKGAVLFVVRGMSLKTEFRLGVATRPLAFGQDCKALIAREDIHPEFLAYALRSKAATVLGMVEEAGHGTGTLQTGPLKKLTIPIPPISLQRAVAEVLGALDDKIECNSRLAAASVRLAREEFRRLPAVSATVRLGEVATINRAVRGADEDDTIEYVDISSVAEGALRATKVYESRSAPSRARRKVLTGDTIWSSVRPNRKSYLLIIDPPPNLVVSTGFTTLSPTVVGPAYLHCAVTTERFVDYLTASATGSAYPAVKSQIFEQARIALPGNEHLEAFERAAWPLLERAHSAQRESRALAALRDALLPKLMSGEIRLQEAEEMSAEIG